MTDPHPSSADLAYATAGEIMDRLVQGTLTSRELVATLRERIEFLEEHLELNIVAGLSEDALAVAEERDDERTRGEIRGSLHGLPVLLKDNIEAVGLPGLSGSTALIGRPTRDATLVTHLREAGAIILGSVNMSQWANMRSTNATAGYSASGGLVANPWALDRSAGGSSSGSGAAAAAGYAPLVVGTETDGSITSPASLNGVVGLKPTVGNVSKQHVIPITNEQDSPGPLTRCVADATLLYAALSDTTPPAARDTLSMTAVTNWRCGHLATDALVAAVIEDLRTSGVAVSSREAQKPGFDEGGDELYAMLCEYRDDLDAYLAGRPGEGPRSMAEVLRYERDHSDVECQYFGHEQMIAALATHGRASSDYAERRGRVTTWAQGTILEALGDSDVLLAAAYGPAWKSDLTLSDRGVYYSSGISVAATAGWPIMCVPIGQINGLPVGMTILGRANDEYTVLQAAGVIENVVRSRGIEQRATFRPPSRG